MICPQTPYNVKITSFQSEHDLPPVTLQRQNNILPVKTRIALVPLQRHVVLSTEVCWNKPVGAKCFKITSVCPTVHKIQKLNILISLKMLRWFYIEKEKEKSIVPAWWLAISDVQHTTQGWSCELAWSLPWPLPHISSWVKLHVSCRIPKQPRRATGELSHLLSFCKAKLTNPFSGNSASVIVIIIIKGVIIIMKVQIKSKSLDFNLSAKF